MISFKKFLLEADYARGLRNSGVGGAAGKERPLATAIRTVGRELSNSRLNVFKSVRKWNNRYIKPELKSKEGPTREPKSFIKLKTKQDPSSMRAEPRGDIGPQTRTSPKEVHDTGPTSTVHTSNERPQAVSTSNVGAKPKDRSKGSVKVTTKPLNGKVRHSSPLKKTRKI